MFRKVLIANRGVAAVRIARTLRRLNVESIALRSATERDADYFEQFDVVVDLQTGDVKNPYLDQQQILKICAQTQAEAVHPGYGFLSENADFAEAVSAAGMAFIGPSPSVIREFGLKHRARSIARDAGVDLLPGSELISNKTDALAFADGLGYPVMVKSTAGGGGIGLQKCASPEELDSKFEQVTHLAANNFGQAGVFIERCVETARHVEVQVFGDGRGGVAVIGDRDCSLQRRHQKVIEECPAPQLSETTRARLHAQARALAAKVSYASAGTIEFLYEPVTEQSYFLEVNTRLQVEHGVTEEVYGIDLVEWMLQQATGELPPIESLAQTLKPQGHSIQARFYAEDPASNFRPSPGSVRFQPPSCERTRFDTWLQTGINQISHQFDPLLANVIVCSRDRKDAIDALDQVLAATQLWGRASNLSYLRQALRLADFRDGDMHTGSLSQLLYDAQDVEVISGGTETTLQSYPGRQGYWHVGVPPSGPMDDLSFRLGNHLLGNESGDAGLEIVFSGPTLTFRHDALAVLTGAPIEAMLGDVTIPMWQPFSINAGSTLQLGRTEQGLRTYLLIGGGFCVPEELGSSATFTLANMGGLVGGALQTGDILQTNPEAASRALQPPLASPPDLASKHDIRVLLGPHTAPDFFTEKDMHALFDATWKVHHNSNRTGVRLIGPQPEWAREDGGEAGLHPSNIHDNAYAFGSLDFTGDMPVILGPDGPSLGGFVCPAVVINADRWKLGQLVPGDELRLHAVSAEDAEQILAGQEQWIAGSISVQPPSELPQSPTTSPVIWASTQVDTDVVVRQAGQEWVLIELGAAELDIETRLRVHQLQSALSDEPGIVEMTAGIRSLQVRFAHRQQTAKGFTQRLSAIAADVVNRPLTAVESRTIQLPLSWEDPACQLAIERYMTAVREDAPWCPDNIEFIRRINGLDDRQDVKDIVMSAAYLVMGLGDVYLGAPVATPLDPASRLVTTKYNPARTWTAENSVGIGGSYLCVYGMEGPGGYQCVGRTVPVWRPRGMAANDQRPWLLRHFDQIRFYEVDADTLLEMRRASKRGAFSPEVTAGRFDPVDYANQLERNSDRIASFRTTQQAAFRAELDRWQAQGLLTFEAAAQDTLQTPEVPEGNLVLSPITASVWKLTRPQTVDVGHTVAILEAMKTEFEVKAPAKGQLRYLVKEGQVVEAGQALATITS